MQVSIAADSVLPRDRMVNVLHFDNPIGMPDNPEALCNDLAVVYDTKVLFSPGTNEIDVRLYHESIKGPPLGKKVINTGKAPVSPCPREVSLCLSFRGEKNTPSTRGRLFIPVSLIMSPTGGLSTRPPLAFRDRLLALADSISALGGIDIDWGVYSPRNDTFVKAVHAWVDDEWDTVRSRGLRATTRSSKAVTG